MMGDQISTPVQERWLPVTDTGTARQKTQRAFAIEFLCPFVALDEYLQRDFSEEAVEDAGEYFGVSDLAVRSHLANHGRIPYDAVTV
jgi:Zn-dependent peptidase ImmA (M78 family)